MHIRQVSWLVLPLHLAACAAGDVGSADGDDGFPDTETGDSDSDGPGDGDGDGDGDAQTPLALSIETPDGACVDLSVTERETYAVRFTASGPPSATLELWASKDQCEIEPFVYVEIALDETGHGEHTIEHAGTDACTDTLLGGWTTWLVDGDHESAPVDLAFSSSACPHVNGCELAAGACPASDEPPKGPQIPPDQLFVLSPAERELFTAPPEWLEWGTNYEDYPLHNLWDAFDLGQPPAPLDPEAGPSGWFEIDGTGSQNHALLWMGESALGHAFSGDLERYESAAANCLKLLELDQMQGHMRQESVGQYVGFWQGGIAAMALAGMYAPEQSTLGPQLLEASRAWWSDHVATLRALRMPDGQVALIGARLPGVAGEEDAWMSLSAAVSLQLLDPLPHDALHTNLAALVTADGAPAAGNKGVPINWYRPRHVSERWVVLRAIQSGALPPVDDAHPVPHVLQDVYRWTAGDRTHVATPAVTGYRSARWHASWAPGTVLRIELGDDASTPHTGKGPHLPPDPLNIPDDAVLVLGDG